MNVRKGYKERNSRIVVVYSVSDRNGNPIYTKAKRPVYSTNERLVLKWIRLNGGGLDSDGFCSAATIVSTITSSSTL